MDLLANGFVKLNATTVFTWVLMLGAAIPGFEPLTASLSTMTALALAL